MWIMWITLWRNIICNLKTTSKNVKNLVKSRFLEKFGYIKIIIYVNRLSTKKSTGVVHNFRAKPCG